MQLQPTIIFLAPSSAILMCNVDRPEGIDTTSLLEVIIGGGPLSSDYMLKFRDLLPGTNVSLVYGQTEVTGLLSAFRVNSRRDILLLNQKPDSCGRIYPGIKYKVMLLHQIILN